MASSAILLVLAAATAASVVAERAVLSALQHRQLVQVHSASWVQEFPNESYENMSNLAQKLEDVTSKLKEKVEGDLEKRSQDSERSANDYGALLTGLSDGLHTYKRTIDDFRSMEQQRQRQHAEEVKQVLTGKEHTASAGKTEQPEAQHDEVVADAESSSTTEESTTQQEIEESTTQPETADESSEETDTEDESSEETDTEEEKAEVPEATDTKEAQKTLANLDEGNFSNNMMDEEKVRAVTEAVQKVGREARMIKGCFDLMGDPVASERTCKDSFKKHYCEDRKPKAACKKADECTVKYVCKGKDNSINSVNGSWKIEENQKACADQQMEARATCVPQEGDYKLPLVE